MVAARKISALIFESTLKGQPSLLMLGQWSNASRLARDPQAASRLLIVSRGFVSQTGKDLRPASALFNSQIGGTQTQQILKSPTVSSSLGQPGSNQLRAVNITNKLQLRYTNVNLSASSRPMSHIGSRNEATEEEKNATALSNTDEHRPLAVLMVWLMANEKNVEKYRQIYLRRGFDVLTVRTSPLDLLLPENGGKKVAESIVNFLNGTALDYEKIIVHLFSVGAYQFSEVMLNLMNQGEKSEEMIQHFRKRIRGLILDSPVDLHGAPHGVAKSLFPKNPYLLKIVEWLLDAYLIRFERGTSRHLRTIQKTFYSNPLKLPSLVLASEKDPIANPDYLAPFLSHWRAGQVPIDMRTWKDTPHVAHYARYPDEYESLVDQFLRKVNIIGDSNSNSRLEQAC